MTVPLSAGSIGGKPTDTHRITHTEYTNEQAIEANLLFDEIVKHYLRNWIAQGTVPALSSTDLDANTGTLAEFARYVAHEGETDEYVEQGALRAFFKHHDDALEQLLAQPGIAAHLLRPGHTVFFEPDAYEPLLAKFERRIYNLAAHRDHREIPFRYSPTSRQGTHGDSVGWEDMPADTNAREDIGYYFGTRRSDETALGILARQLRQEAALAGTMPIHVMTEGHMTESLLMVKTATEQFQAEGDVRTHCFVIQRRHAADDRHLGTALLLMNPDQPNVPQRIIFCDTLTPNGIPPWWESFKRKIDGVFPQPEGNACLSDRLEDGGVNLQRLHEGIPVRHQDIDCAFYSASMARALIQTAVQEPDVLLHGPADAVMNSMTSRMREYFEAASVPKSPTTVREVNIIRRWNTGREALVSLMEG